MRPVELQLVHDRLDVFTRAVLRVFLGVLRHFGGRIAACIESNAAIPAGKMAHLRFPGPAVACKLVYEHDRNIRSDVLVKEFDAVVGGEKGHALAPQDRIGPSHRTGGAEPSPVTDPTTRGAPLPRNHRLMYSFWSAASEHVR